MVAGEKSADNLFFLFVRFSPFPLLFLCDFLYFPLDYFLFVVIDIFVVLMNFEGVYSPPLV